MLAVRVCKTQYTGSTPVGAFQQKRGLRRTQRRRNEAGFRDRTGAEVPANPKADRGCEPL